MIEFDRAKGVGSYMLARRTISAKGNGLRGISESGAKLAFAVAHEVGNHLAGIRLQSHLLDEDLGARELAEASVMIDDLAGRAGPLLTLLRPLLSDDWRRTSHGTWSNVLATVQRQIEDDGTRGASVQISCSVGADREAPEFDWLHAGLVAILEATINHSGRGRQISLDALEGEGDSVILRFEDDAEAEDVSSEAATRGRPLAVGILRELLERIGGRVDVARVDDRTRVDLVFPAV